MTLTISLEGQVTLPREVLDHLGVAPGEVIALDLLPDGRGALHSKTPIVFAREQTGVAESPLGMFKTDKQVSIEEMNQTIAMGWAGLLDDDDD